MSYKHRFAAMIIVAAIFFVNIPAVFANNRDRSLRVVTYNMYLGTDFTEIFSAQTFEQVVEEVAEAYGDVEAGDPAARINAIADQIEAAGPALVGLQEVALWRTGAAFDPAPATDVSFDFLQMLLNALAERGLKYQAAAIHTGFDAELPAVGPNVFADVRYTDRAVILVRSDIQTSQLTVEGSSSGTFATLLTLPLLIGNISIQRGWTSVDVKMRGKTYRFINAHTEAFHPGVQFVQALELLQGPANTSLPVILAGDLNSDAEASGASYLLLTGSGFNDAWEISRPSNSGYTWPLFLASPSTPTPPNERLDLILFRGAFTVNGTDILGEDQVVDVTPSGLRPSDHAGVSATLVLEP
jgi:endonuclease/exonuclease/phosphatase family metal-dependent hydrolase